MAPPARKLRLALDHNFPAPVLAAFASMMGRVELVPIREIDERLAELDDWKLFVELERRGGWDGLVTNDDALLSLAKEMRRRARRTSWARRGLQRGRRPRATESIIRGAGRDR